MSQAPQPGPRFAGKSVMQFLGVSRVSSTKNDSAFPICYSLHILRTEEVHVARQCRASLICILYYIYTKHIYIYICIYIYVYIYIRIVCVCACNFALVKIGISTARPPPRFLDLDSMICWYIVQVCFPSLQRLHHDASCACWMIWGWGSYAKSHSSSGVSCQLKRKHNMRQSSNLLNLKSISILLDYCQSSVIACNLLRSRKARHRVARSGTRKWRGQVQPVGFKCFSLNQAHPSYPGFASYKAGHAERHTMQLRKPFG